MSKLLKVVFLLSSIFLSQTLGQNKNRAFFIRSDSENISYFNINLITTPRTIGTTVKLYERQIFMTRKSETQAIALLSDVSFKTTGDTIYYNIAKAVCISPNTPWYLDLMRFNPGADVLLFDTGHSFPENNQDWKRAKIWYQKANSTRFPTINVIYRIQPSDISKSMPVRINIIASSMLTAKRIAKEEIERFNCGSQESWIRQKLSKPLGLEKVNKLVFVRLEKIEKEAEPSDYIAIFRVW